MNRTDIRRTTAAKAARESGGFFAIPYVVIRSKEWTQLSAHAVKLVIDLAAQYSGHNNGDFSAHWELMKSRGWVSKDTLYKGVNELLEAGFIVKTRQGKKRKGAPTLYGVTFHVIDECGGKLDIEQRDFRGMWRKQPAAVPPLKVTRYPKSADARAAIREADPELLKTLVRREYQTAPSAL